jgi:hypothetical protein
MDSIEVGNGRAVRAGDCEACSFLPLIEGPICTEVILQIGAQRPELAVALAEAIANGSEEQCEQLGGLLNPDDLNLLIRVCSGVLNCFGIGIGKA